MQSFLHRYAAPATESKSNTTLYYSFEVGGAIGSGCRPMSARTAWETSRA